MAAKKQDPTAKRREPPMVEQLRQAIRNSGQTLNELARNCDVDPGILSRFLRSERSITIDVAGRICEALGVTLAVPAAEKRKK